MKGRKKKRGEKRVRGSERDGNGKEGIEEDGDKTGDKEEKKKRK